MLICRDDILRPDVMQLGMCENLRRMDPVGNNRVQSSATKAEELDGS